MGVFLLKFKFHFCSLIKVIIYKLLYGNSLIIGKGTTFRRRFSIYIEKNSKLKIGKMCFFNNDCSINVLESVDIGDGCIFGEGVKIYDHNHLHKINDMFFKDQGFDTESVKIGNNCWIGSNVIILKGVTIGDNSVIGAGCIVYKSVDRDSVIVSGRMEHCSAKS